MSSSTLGAPSQYSLLATQRTNLPFCHSTTWNGPEPTIGGLLRNAVISSYVVNWLQMCSGMIGTHMARTSALGLSHSMTTVVSSGAVTVLMPSSAERKLFSSNSLWKLYVKATSAAVRGSPSDHLTPWRILK